MDPNQYFLTDDETAEILEPIAGHDHCWGMLAAARIKEEKALRARLTCDRTRTGAHEYPADQQPGTPRQCLHCGEKE